MEVIVKKVNALKGKDGVVICQNITWDNSGSSFKKCNIIYGKNGTGKTMIARMLRNIDEYRDCFELRTGITQNNIKVFTKDFTEDELYFDRKPNLNGDINPIILYTGQDEVKDRKRLKHLNKRLLSLKETQITKNNELEISHKTWAKHIKEKYGMPYNDENYQYYNTTKLNHKLETLSENYAKGSSIPLLSTEDKYRLELSIKEDSKDPLEYININQDNLKEQTREVIELIKQSVVTNFIDAFSKNPELNNWAKTGLDIHEKHRFTKCQFCDNDLNEERKQKLKMHFDDSYKRLEQSLNSAIYRCKEINYRLHDPDKVYVKYRKEYSDRMKELDMEIEKYNQFQQKLRYILEDKKRIIMEAHEIDLKYPDIDLESKKGHINSIISNHNQYHSNIQTEKKQAIEQLVNDHIMDNYLEKYRASNEKNKKYNRLIETVSNKCEYINNKKFDKSEAMKQINEKLELCFKHKKIKFEPQSSGYKITRDGKPAKHLSEGEENIIALVYFLQTLSDANIKLDDVCVVIDDPVSSLDDENFFCALNMIIETFKLKSQIIILTHHGMLLEQIINEGYKKNLYEIERYHNDNGTINVKMKLIDKRILKMITEYSLIFRMLWQICHKSKLSDADISTSRNTIRRLIETFCAFNFPDEDNFGGKARTFFKKEETVFYDAGEAIKILHTGSHASLRTIYGLQYIMSDKIITLIKSCFKAIRSHNPSHYEGMLEIMKKRDKENYQDNILEEDSTDNNTFSQKQTNNDNGGDHQQQESMSSDLSDGVTDEKNKVNYTIGLYSDTKNQSNKPS